MRPSLRHCLEGVDDGQQTRSKVDFIADQPGRRTTAVKVFMVLQHHGSRFLPVRQRCQQPGRDLWMAAQTFTGTFVQRLIGTQ